jgi:sulfur-oxidizing protein SoxY
VKAAQVNPRRRYLRAGFGAALLPVMAKPATAATNSGVSIGLPPADSPLWKQMNRYAAGQKIEQGLVTLDISELVESGNSVSTKVRVQSEMTSSQYVQSITLFNELNPVTEILEVQLTPANPIAEIETRIKLANSQWVVALAKTNDGRCFAQARQVVVTLGSCVG